MKPKDGFDAAVMRADHLLRLYDLLRDTRSRSVRGDWKASFLSLMHWPAGEAIIRVDGKDKNSLLILRPSLGLDNTRFTHEYLSELLRSSVVATVSALDRYMHDKVVQHSWALLRRPEARIPAELRKLSIPVLATKHALEKLRTDARARPGNLVKAALQEHLHRDYTFQKPDDVAKAAKMLGIKNFWEEVERAFPVTTTRQDLIDKLKEISTRRNQIVHEADLYRRTRGRRVILRDISRTTAGDWCQWTRDFVTAIDKVVGVTM